MNEVRSDLKDIDVAIANVEVTRSNHPILGKSEGSNWKADEQIKSSLDIIIKAGNAVSDACTKLTIFVPTNPKEKELESLVSEMQGYIQALFCEYMNLTQTGIGKSCFGALSGTVRQFFIHVRELIDLLSTRSYDSCKSALGLVWKSAKELGAVPVSNKAACRRSLMRDCQLIKDTEREFTQYLTTALSKHSNEAVEKDDNDEEEGDGDDDEEDEDEYSPEETVIVRSAIDLISLSFNLVKLSLSLMTAVADANVGVSTPSVFTNVSSSSSAELPANHVMVWVSSLVAACHQTGNAITDFGVELYPPVTLEALTEPKNLLISQLRQVIDILQSALADSAAASCLGELNSLAEKISSFSVI